MDKTAVTTLATLCVVLLAPRDGWSQERTAAGAQAYLRTAAAGRSVEYTPNGFRGSGKPILSAETEGECTTRFLGEPPTWVRINWRTVSAVELPRPWGDGFRVDVTGGGFADFAFFVPSETAANRLQTAADFLRIRCDPNAGSGF